MTRLANYLCANSKYASAEQKKLTLDTIVASGVEGIPTSKIRKTTGLDLNSHKRLMRQLSDYGAIRKVGKYCHGKSNEPLWSAIY